MYRTEVKVAALSVPELIDKYFKPEKFERSCCACPEYGNRWSCPPGTLDAKSVLSTFSRALIVGVKVIYDDETRAQAVSPEKTQLLRQDSYEKVKRELCASLCELEKHISGSWSLASGRCELCRACSREDGLPCLHPDDMRFSIAGLGIDLVQISKDVLDMPLLWENRGLPEYNVAIAAFLLRDGIELEQKFLVNDVCPWEVFIETALGVLKRAGCSVIKRDQKEQLDIYMDTKNLDILKNDCSLRVRFGNGCRILTLKRPKLRSSGLFAREEVEAVLKADGCEKEQLQLFINENSDLTAIIKDKQLYSALEVLNDRYSVEVKDCSTGDCYEIAFDSVKYSRKNTSGTEHQLEIECKKGSGRRIQQLSETLLQSIAGLKRENATKLQRGIILTSEKA